MQGTLLASAISPDNTPHGYNLTFLFPEILFVVVAVALYLRFRSRHLALLSGRRPYAMGARATATATAGASPAKDDTTHRSTLQDGEASAVREAAEQETTVLETTEEGE